MKNRILIILLCSTLIAALFIPMTKSLAATKEITIDEDVYNVYTDNFPDPIGDDVYAKFTSSVKDAEEYYLDFDQESAESSFKTALTKNKISYNEDYICYMKAFLYKYNDDGDSDISVTNQKLEIYFPLPMDAQEHAEDCAFYKLTSGKLTPVYPLTLYSIEDVNYIKIALASPTDFSTIYGFVYNDPESYEEEDSDDEDDYDEEDDDDEFEEDDEVATPTPKPTSTPTPKPTATPTPKPDSGSDKSGSTGSGSGAKNTIPKTGDDFPLKQTIFIGAGAAVLFGLALIFQKKKK